MRSLDRLSNLLWELGHLRMEEFHYMESLILAQDKRWRRVLGMQVEREAHLRVSGERRTGE